MKKIKKNTKQFQNERKNYDSIKQIISRMYLEPAYNFDNTDQKIPAGQRDMLRRIFNYIDSRYIKKSDINNHNLITFISDMYKCPVNYIADTYRYSSYTHDQLIFFVTFMQILSNAGKADIHGEGLTDLTESFTKKDLCGDVRSRIIDNQDSYSIENIFDDLVELGFIELTNEGSSKHKYRIAKDLLNYVDNLGQLPKLLEMVIFFYNIHPLVIPGYNLAVTINQYLIYSFPDKQDLHFTPSNNIFIYKNMAMHNAIYNNNMWRIITAVKNKQMISYSYKEQNGKIENYKIAPFKIVIEQEYNRQYVYGYHYDKNSYGYSRIDRMDNITVLQEVYSDTELKDCFIDNNQYKWMVADNNDVSLVRIFFSFPIDEKEKIKMAARLYNTKRNGKLVEKENGLEYTIYTTNQLELVPWINGFGRYAEVDKNQNPDLYNKIKEHTMELMNKYGLI